MPFCHHLFARRINFHKNCQLAKVQNLAMMKFQLFHVHLTKFFFLIHKIILKMAIPTEKLTSTPVRKNSKNLIFYSHKKEEQQHQ